MASKRQEISNQLFIGTTFGDDEGRAVITFLWFRGRFDNARVNAAFKTGSAEIQITPKTNGDVKRALREIGHLSGSFNERAGRNFAPINERMITGKFVRQSFVAISNSPPSSELIGDLLKNTDVLIGALAHPDISNLIVAISIGAAGIIIIGASRGISDGVRDGLHQVVKEWIIKKGRSKRGRKKKDKVTKRE